MAKSDPTKRLTRSASQKKAASNQTKATKTAQAKRNATKKQQAKKRYTKRHEIREKGVSLAEVRSHFVIEAAKLLAANSDTSKLEQRFTSAHIGRHYSWSDVLTDAYERCLFDRDGNITGLKDSSDYEGLEQLDAAGAAEHARKQATKVPPGFHPAGCNPRKPILLSSGAVRVPCEPTACLPTVWPDSLTVTA